MPGPDVGAEDTVQVPSTPPATGKDAINKSAHATSPVPAGSMTPPPSTQPRRFQSTQRYEDIQSPMMRSLSPTGTRLNSSANIPTTEKIENANIEELRKIVKELVMALSDARMSAAHFKLQHTLLTMETHEAQQRAEVEHQMAKREVEALHMAEQRHRAASLTPKLHQSPQPQIIALTRTCKDLEEERDEIEDQLQQARKYLDFEKGRAEMLVEENTLLKKRIRENREHFTKLRDHSPLYATPRQPFTTPRRKSYSRFNDNIPAHDNFAALLYADQMLSQETASVPSTPTKSQTSRVKQGHVRGAHSLSSLQTTPARRIFGSEEYAGAAIPASAPGPQMVSEVSERDRHDRDSTISISDAEGDGMGEDITQSQASSLATDMLRRNPASQESMRQSQDAERSSNLLQTKLFGNVSKSTGKRMRKDDIVSNKKAKLNEGIGLGVGMDRWNRASS